MTEKTRASLEPAYLLHQYAYRDSSRIAEFLTREHGRISAVARGIRRARSRTAGLLQPFQPLLVSWTGRDLMTLTGIEGNGTAPGLKGDALLAGFYVNELCLRLLASHDPHPEIFDLYQACLADLAGHDGQLAIRLRYFEADLLEALGYGLLLDADKVTGEVVQADALYSVDPETGPTRVADSTQGRLMLQGGVLLALGRRAIETAEQERQARTLLRAALDRQLGGRPLKSLDVLRSIYRQQGGDK
ncbi:MAG: DNA repair protein RecO [Gammaproteobacteria bacterium]|nr:DNA repair protein RecO [Gammaproteobacteria bacterium]